MRKEKLLLAKVLREWKGMECILFLLTDAWDERFGFTLKHFLDNRKAQRFTKL